MKKYLYALAFSLFATFLVISCGTKTPESGELIYDFNNACTGYDKNQLVPDSMELYIDYTTAFDMKAKIKFYWEVMRPIIKNKSKVTYAIKGQEISRVDDNVENILKNVTNIPNADIKGAIDKIVESNKEAMLITDAEMIDPAEPYMKDAFKKWLLKGHDIFILSEPYVEKAAKISAKKLLFFIIFYDANMDRNICEYVKKHASLNHYPKINKLNISLKPNVIGLHGGHSAPNEHTQAMVTRKGNMEYQEWNNGWEDQIIKFVVNANDMGGNEIEHGLPIIDALKIDRNSIAGLVINGIKMKVSNINKQYAEFYEARKKGEIVDDVEMDFDEMENFIVLNQDLFNKNANIQLLFDKKNFNLDCLDGEPYNYFKIDFYISDMKEDIEKFRTKLEFDDILKEDCKNISVFESFKQTVEDPELTNYIANTPIYTIYVKAQKK